MIDYFVAPARRHQRGSRPAARRRRSARSPRCASAASPPASSSAPITEGTLNLPDDCARAAAVAGGPFKFTLTSPYMLARTLLDDALPRLPRLTLAIADALAAQAARSGVRLRAGGRGEHPRQSGRRAARRRGDQPRARRRARRRRPCTSASATTAARRFRTAPGGRWSRSSTRCTPITWSSSWRTGRRRISRRSRDLDADIGIGLGVVDIKVNHVETAGRDRRAPSSAPSARSAPAACATCIRTAGSGCSSARSPTARSPRSSKGRDLYPGPREHRRDSSRWRRSTSSCCPRGPVSRSATASRA